MSERNRSWPRSCARAGPPHAEEVGLVCGGRRRIELRARSSLGWPTSEPRGTPGSSKGGRSMAAGTLDRIGAVLRLDSSESEYLRKLVYGHGRARGDWNGLPSPPSPRWCAATPPATRPDRPALGRRALQRALRALLKLSDGAQGLERNGLWLMFTRQRARWVYPDWEATARRMVATFRVEYADDAATWVRRAARGALGEQLGVRQAVVRGRRALADALSAGRMRDPDSGRVLNYETVTLRVPDAPDQMLVFHVPAERWAIGTPSGFSTSAGTRPHQARRLPYAAAVAVDDRRDFRPASTSPQKARLHDPTSCSASGGWSRRGAISIVFGIDRFAWPGMTLSTLVFFELHVRRRHRRFRRRRIRFAITASAGRRSSSKARSASRSAS